MAPSTSCDGALAAIRCHARPLGQAGALDPLYELLASRRFALLGEASHGTQEFYRQRAGLTQQLIAHHGCRAVVIEGDWPDAYRVNRWVRWLDEEGSAARALGGFERFPTWMWRNTVMRDFVQWLRDYNRDRPPWLRVGVYGMDLYSLLGSVEAVLRYLDQADPAAARRARRRYACFDHFHQDLQAYGYAAGFGTGFSCEDAVVQQMHELMRQAASRAGTVERDPDALFHAQQNARLVHSAEQYYRSMFKGRVSSWNLRDLHMADTLQALSTHLQERTGEPPRIAVWAHNSHLGDARATAMGVQGEWNVGELMRRRFPADVALVGFTTYTGTVMAATEWDGPGEVMQVRPGLPGSWEDLLHQGPADRFLLMLRGSPAREALSQPLLERAIGVIYQPQTERRSHYFTARLAEQFDAVIHIDVTAAVEALGPARGDEDGAPVEKAKDPVPETYPSGV